MTFEIDHEVKQQTAGEIAAHPERKALANLWNNLAVMAVVVNVTLVLCLPAAVYWAYHVARGVGRG